MLRRVVVVVLFVQLVVAVGFFCMELVPILLREKYIDDIGRYR